MQHCESEQDFRDKVLEGIAVLRTQMNALVGADGTNGRVGSLEERITSLEVSRGRQKGFMAAISLATGLAGAAAEWFFRR